MHLELEKLHSKFTEFTYFQLDIAIMLKIVYRKQFNMDLIVNGAELQRQICGDRPWWGLNERGIRKWLDSLPRCAEEIDIGVADWVGIGWDGRCDLRIAGDFDDFEEFPALEMHKILDEIGYFLNNSGIDNIKIPNSDNVRICTSHIDEETTICIDLCFHDFIIPIAIANDMLFPSEIKDLDQVINMIINCITYADSIKDKLLKKNLVLEKE